MKFLRLPLAGLVAVLVMAGCTVADPPAITIDDWSLSRSEFLAELDEILASEELVVMVGQSTTTTSSPTSLATSNAAALASAHVQIHLYEYLREQLGIDPVDDQVVAQAMEEVSAQLPDEVGEYALALIEDSVRLSQLDQQIQEALTADFDGTAAAQEFYEESLAQGALPDESCVDVIVAAPPVEIDPATGAPIGQPTQAELDDARARADDLLGRLDAGEDFTELASAESDDPQTAAAGGTIGCYSAGQLNPTIDAAVAALDIGVHSAVLDLGGQYVIVRVTSRGVASLESFLALYEQQTGADLVTALAQTHVAEKAQPMLARAALELDVTVDPLSGDGTLSSSRWCLPRGQPRHPSTSVDSSTMSRSWTSSWLVALAALSLAACSSGTPEQGAPPTLADGAVLNVDGFSVSKAEFDDQLAQIESNQAYLDARAEARDGNRIDVASPDVVVEFLNERVSFALVRAELARRRIEPTSVDQQAARELLDGAGIDEAVLGGFGSYADVLVDGEAAIVALTRELSGQPETRIESLYEQYRDQLEMVACVDHIVVLAGPGDREAIDGVAARLASGEDFADVAAEVSADEISAPLGGDLGCRPQGRLLDQLDSVIWSAEPGVVSEPVQTDVGWHLVRVRERRVPSIDEAAPTLVELALRSARAGFVTWLGEAARSAEVAVDATYGEWDAEAGSVVAPGRSGRPTEMSLERQEEVP